MVEEGVCELLLTAVSDPVCLNLRAHYRICKKLYMQPAQGFDIALRHEKPFLKWLAHITPHN